MKTRLYLLFAISTILMVACQEEEDLPKTCFGECSYYPSFLWSDADTCGVTKHLYLDFSNDAKEDEEAFAEIAFVDKEGNAIPDDILEITVDGVVIKDNIFKVYPNETERELMFRYLPKAKSGNHQGYIKLISYKLDRFEDQELSGEPVEVMRWDLYFDKCMNPLAKVLMWIVIVLMALLLIWFVFLRPVLYPHFKTFTKSFLVEKEGRVVVQMNCSFKGARRVIFSDRKKKQSFLNRLFTGEIKYLVNPIFVESITFSPKNNNAVAYGNGYIVKPNPIPKSGKATINHDRQKLVIIIR